MWGSHDPSSGNAIFWHLWLLVADTRKIIVATSASDLEFDPAKDRPGSAGQYSTARPQAYHPSRQTAARLLCKIEIQYK